MKSDLVFAEHEAQLAGAVAIALGIKTLSN
jgi:hypothetical protein